MVQHGIGNLLDGSGHGIAGVHGTNDDGPVPAALVVADTGRFVVGNDGEILPYLASQAILGKLLAKDGIGFTQGFETVAGNGTCATNAQAGPGTADGTPSCRAVQVAYLLRALRP